MQNLKQYGLLAAVPLAALAVYMYPLWLSSNWVYLMVALLLMGTPLWWQGYKAVSAHIHECKDRESFRALFDAAAEQVRAGGNLKFSNPRNGAMIELTRPSHLVSKREEAPQGEQPPPAIEAPPDLPTHIAYEEIRDQIPPGHILVGVGRYGRVETKEQAVGACVLIIGLSGTGKTTTTSLRVEERYNNGHKFLGIDPHFFKDESLFHAIYENLDETPGPYQPAFLKPMATNPEEILAVLKVFHEEFKGRKEKRIPKPWQKITLLVDEVGSLMDKATASTPEEKEIIELLPSIARICGQEARNFAMGGIFMSQQATGLAWLRKVALMIIVHQLLMDSEKALACNHDTAVIENMKRWPIGRTYIYGVGFTGGPLTVQQPYFKREHMVEIANHDESTVSNSAETGELIDADLKEALNAWKQGATSVRAMQQSMGVTQYRAYQLYLELKAKNLINIE